MHYLVLCARDGAERGGTYLGELLKGLIVKEQSGFYWVEADDGRTYMCELRGRLKEEAKTSDIAAIGDRAAITTRREEGTDVTMGVIESLAPRQSVLSRAQRTTGKRGVGQAEREQVVIANAGPRPLRLRRRPAQSLIWISSTACLSPVKSRESPNC